MICRTMRNHVQVVQLRCSRVIRAGVCACGCAPRAPVALAVAAPPGTLSWMIFFVRWLGYNANSTRAHCVYWAEKGKVSEIHGKFHHHHPFHLPFHHRQALTAHLSLPLCRALELLSRTITRRPHATCPALHPRPPSHVTFLYFL